jgi:DNA gyrase/topoisomerase IV subunit B
MLHLVWEVVGNAVDLYLAGRCTRIALTLLRDGTVRVEDDGPGLPVVGADGTPFLVRALTELHDAPTKDGHPVHVHIAAHGLGLSVVHALSEHIGVTTSWEGRRWVVSGGAGVLSGPPRDEGPSAEVGTTVSFRPDPTVFPNVLLDVATLVPRLREVVALCPGLTIRFSDERILELHQGEGLVGLLGVAPAIPPRRCLHPAPWRPAVPLSGRAGAEGMSVDVRLQWALDGEPQVRSFVNLAETPGGGSHVSGLERGLRALACALAVDDPEDAARVLGKYVVAVVSVLHFEPTFAGPTRDRLASPEIEPLVEGAVEACLLAFVASRREEAEALLAWVLEREERGW